MQTKIENVSKNTVNLTVTVPVESVKEAYNHVLKHFAEHAEIAGFRKGQAPIAMVEKNAKQSELNGEVVNELLQKFYPQAVKEHHLSPIGNPKVSIKSFDKDQAFEFEAKIALKPEIKMGDYRKKLKTAWEEKNKKFKEEKEASEKKAKENEKTEEKSDQAHHSHAHAHGDHVHLSIDEVIEAIVAVTEVEISEVLIEDEVTRMLSRLLQQAETLGLTVDQYLSAQNKTIDDLRKEFEGHADRSLKGEFALSKAIELEQIKVEDEEVTEAINAIGDEEVRKRLQSGVDRWYILSVLAKNKLISKLASELEPKAEEVKK